MLQCARCNTPMQADDAFCPKCGLSAGQQSAEPEAPVSKTVDGLKTIDGTSTKPHKDQSKQKDLAPGTEFAERYTIEAVVGRGGMGVVYRAADKLANQTVALKLIRPERAAGEAAIKRLIAEGTNSRNIRHKNVIAVYDVGEVDGQPFISMEYLDHGSLRAWHRQQALNRETVPMRVAARIIMELLDGLQAAHGVGIVHRDLKPENIVLVGEPDDKTAPLKILDFGIANSAGIPETSTGTGMGTVGYMAPEQITNPAAAIDSADLYSLSVIFYELLMDVQPVGHWQPPSGGRSDVPYGIDQLIEDGLSNRPASRPQSAVEYRKRLIEAVNGRVTPPPVPPQPPQPPSNVLKWIGGGVAGLFVLGLIGSMMPSEVVVQPDGNNPEPIGPVDPHRVDPPPEPIRPVPQPNPYADISGRWHFCDGSSRNVQVNRDGGFSYNWTDSSIQGVFQGGGGRFEQTVSAGGYPFLGQMQRVDQGHIDYATYSPDGTLLVDAGRIHINHQPGPGDC